MYNQESERLFSLMSDKMVDALINADAFIAGGIVSRLFSGRALEGADVDVYFRSAKHLAGALYELQGTSDIIFDYTDKSIMIKSDDTVVQFIVIDYFDNLESLFEKFDFTCVMGAFDIKEDKFVFHNDFLYHNAQRRLVYNPKTSFPIISALRVDKYKREGYSISRYEFLKILLSLMTLKLQSWEDAEKQFGKFYGTSLAEIINDEIKEKEFSLENLIEALSDFEFKYSRTRTPNTKTIYDYVQFVSDMTGVKPKLYSWMNGKYFAKNELGNHVVVKPEDILKYDSEIITVNVDTSKVYKYVVFENGELHSQYTRSFKYVVGQNAIDERNGMWFAYINGLQSLKNSYGFQSNRVLIECEPIRVKSQPDYPSDVVMMNEVKVLRIILAEEEKELLETSNQLVNVLVDEIPF